MRERMRIPRLSRRARYSWACVIGGSFAFVVVLFIAMRTGVVPGTRHFSDDFFDAQARAWLAGNWDVDAAVLGGEGYATDHGIQTYFGITPSIMRVPVLLVTDRLDGQLGLVSQFLALAVLLVSTSRLLWTTRRLSSDREPGLLDDVAAGLFVALVGGGSSATFLAAQSTVYAEAILWALALAVASADFLVTTLLRPSWPHAIAAAALAGAALNARVTTGLGALLPVIAVALFALVRTSDRIGSLDGARLRRLAAPMLVMSLASVIIFCGVNWARFGSALSVPHASQVGYRTQPERLANLEAQGGLFSLQYVLTDAVIYLRPDGIRLEPFPAVTFMGFGEMNNYGGARLNLVEPTASIPAAMPALSALALAGIVVLTRRRTRATFSVLRLSVLGAAVAPLFLVTFGSIAHRYTGDFMPLLVLLGTVGLARGMPLRPRGARIAFVVGLSVLTLWGAWTAVGLTMTTAGRNSVRSRPALDDWAATLADMAVAFKVEAPIPQPAAAPRPTGLWTMIADPQCARVYVAYLNGWYAFERQPGTGAFHVRATPPPDDATPHALVRTSNGQQIVGLRRAENGTVLVYSEDGGAIWKPATNFHGLRAEGPAVAQPLPIDEDGTIDLVVDVDDYLHTVTVSGRTPDTFQLVQEPLKSPGGPAELARDYPGSVTEVAEGPPQCRKWTGTTS